MQELDTVGRIHAPGYRIPLSAGPLSGFNLPGMDRFRLVLVERGAAIVRHLGVSLSLDAPCLLCVNELEAVECPHFHEAAGQYIVFHPNVINPLFSFTSLRHPSDDPGLQDRDCLWVFLDRSPGKYGLVNLGISEFTRIRALFSDVADALSQQADSYWPCRARSYLLELLLFTDRIVMSANEAGKGVAQPTNFGADWLPILLSYLHGNYAEAISIDSLCGIFGANRTSLTRKFRQHTGQSIMAYLSDLRTRVAASLLREATLPIHEIMERTGFMDPTHFGRVFKKRYGLSPSTYRKTFYRVGDPDGITP